MGSLRGSPGRGAPQDPHLVRVLHRGAGRHHLPVCNPLRRCLCDRRQALLDLRSLGCLRIHPPCLQVVRGHGVGSLSGHQVPVPPQDGARSDSVQHRHHDAHLHVHHGRRGPPRPAGVEDERPPPHHFPERPAPDDPRRSRLDQGDAQPVGDSVGELEGLAGRSAAQLLGGAGQVPGPLCQPRCHLVELCPLNVPAQVGPGRAPPPPAPGGTERCRGGGHLGASVRFGRREGATLQHSGGLLYATLSATQSYLPIPYHRAPVEGNAPAGSPALALMPPRTLCVDPGSSPVS
mmetsp:Transcript_42878/g.99621  ORF Transcript_42878/g.99621 Transcript_42878/m.99621 type:complete len:291 (+) Transcript_42878:276-1148(+)